MNAIVAVSKSWGIGRNGGMLFELPGDLAWFRKATLGKKVIMGRKTLESLPGGAALPKRDNIVLSKNPKFSAPGCITFHKLSDMLKYIRAFKTDDLFVVGGAQIYKALLPYCSNAYITHVDAEPEIPAECFFPNLSEMSNWQPVEQYEKQTDNGISYYITKYENTRVHDSMKGLK